MVDSSKKIISVITIHLNDKQGLQRTVESVKGQNSSLYEQIIIDGGSNDGSVDYIRENASLFSYWISEKDKGVYDAQNKGIMQAKGEYLLFLNSGDTLCAASVFEEFTQFIKNKEPAIVYGNSHVVKSNNTVEKLVPPNKLSINFWYRNTLNHQAVFFRRDVFERFGAYDVKYKFSADLDLLLKVFKKEPEAFEHFDTFVCNYSETGMSAKPENYEPLISEKENILRTHLTAGEYAMAKDNYFKEQSLRTKYRIFISERPLLKRIASLFHKK